MNGSIGGLTGEVNVLLIEDDVEVARTVQEGLGSYGISVNHAASLAEAEARLAADRFHALVLDLTLPDGDGLDLAGSLRASGNNVPILMLTAKDGVPDRLAGFERGADDYLCKPFDLGELAARLSAVLKRARAGQHHVLEYADLRLDLLTRVVRRPGIETTLSDREAELLAFMMRHPEERLPRERILEQVWGDDIETDSNILNVYINLLRNKIESPSLTPLIRTVRGVGYMFTASEKCADS
jgi:DNA-binding response OmpR family regulator